MDDAQQLMTARDHVARYRTERDQARQQTEGEILSSPACATACTTCRRQCAVASIKLNWWEREAGRIGAAMIAPTATGSNAVH